MKRRKTHDEFTEELELKHDGKIIMIDTYITKRSRGTFKCLTCNHIWQTQNGNIIKNINRSGCPSCAKNELLKRNAERASNRTISLKISIHQRIREKYGNDYILKSEYEHTKVKLLLECNVHGDFYQRFDTLMSGTGCPKCGHEKRAQSLIDKNKTKLSDRAESFYAYVKSLQDDYMCLSEYVNIGSYIKMKHNICGHIWNVTPGNFRWNERRCPKCSFSKNEDGICNFLNKNKIFYSTQFRLHNNKRKRFDFKIGNLLIEYDGEQHFVPIDFAGRGDEWAIQNLSKIQESDKIKNQYCIDNNTPLIRIPYWEKNNIEYILHNVLIHFNLIENEQGTFDKGIVMKYFVDSYWNNDEYIELGKNRKTTNK